MRVPWVKKNRRMRGVMTIREAAMSMCHSVPPCWLWHACRPGERLNTLSWAR